MMMGAKCLPGFRGAKTEWDGLSQKKTRDIRHTSTVFDTTGFFTEITKKSSQYRITKPAELA